MLQEIIGRLPELTGSQLGRPEEEIRRERQRRASSEGGGEDAPQIHEGTAPSWTPFVIVRSGFLAGRDLPNVRRAYRTLQGAVQTYPVGPGSCDGRTYNRLNADYEPMHALCKFFLNNSGPTGGIAPGGVQPGDVEAVLDRHGHAVQQSGCIAADARFVCGDCFV